MKNINLLYKKYKDQTCILFGNGESLLKFKEDKNCIRLGINYSFEKIKDLDYLFLQEYETYKIIKEIFDNNNMIIPFYPGLNIHGTAERITIENKQAYGYELQNPLQNKISDLQNKDLSIDKNIKVFSYTGTSQCALHIIAYMGFKKIRLIGFDYKLYSTGKVHFYSEFSHEYTNQKMNALVRIKEGDDFIIKRLQELYNIEVINENNLR